MDVQLSHGRKELTKEMDMMGFPGPRLTGLISVASSYGTELVFYFQDDESFQKAIEITGWSNFNERSLFIRVTLIDEMIPTKNGFYGDWQFLDSDLEFLVFRLQCDVYAKKIYGISIQDMCGSEAMLRDRLDKYAETPLQYITWVGKKRDLIRVDN